MNQRMRKSRNYRPDSTGSNVLFTLGLISVVALLIVGWVMTKGGFNASALRDLGREIVVLNPSPTAAAALAPSPTPVALAAPAPAVPDSGLQATLDNVKAQYEQTLQQEREQNQKAQEEMRMKYQGQIDELRKKIMLLEMENKGLRGEN